MCGIAGIINLSKKSSCLAPHIHGMALRMKRRGPDDEGYLLVNRANNQRINSFYGDDTPDCRERTGAHIKTAYNTKSHIAFGHRRLNIVDLSFNGHQPMCSKDGRLWIIFNGEIYNYKEISGELETLGYTFFSRTDTEVVLASYIQWGPGCLQRFNGMFAIVIYDSEGDEVFFARDRIGIKPLYYTRQKEQLIFASDIKTIIASGLYKPEVDMEGLWHNLSLYVTPRPNTLFKDVYAIPQAHWMKIHLSTFKITQKRYWQIPIGNQDLTMTEDDAVEELEVLLTKAIQYRLAADVEVGTFMSGGIDSTTISAIASGLHPGINAFTLSFDKTVSEYDELAQARATAKMHRMRHIVEQVNPEEMLGEIDNMVLGYEEPFLTLSPNFIIAKLIAQHGIVVVLNGLGGDELFAGYDHYLNLGVWKIKKTAAAFLPSFLTRYAKLKTIDNYHVDIFSTFKEHDKKKLFLEHKGFDTLNQLRRLYKPPEGGTFTDDIEALDYYDLMSYIGNHHVYRLDQFTMFFSLEGRFPFLDHKLLEFAFRVPSHLKIKKNNPMYQKYILRKVAKKYIAPACLTMPKKGFGLPVGRWMRRELRELTEDSLESLKKRHIFNNRAINELYDTFNESRHFLYKKVWHLVMTELWFQHFIDPLPPEGRK
ncbi:MAG: asparagine synthase (glutamine-hydrolyzing) [bacterium]|nr:asparagine synthase (glutamine-hydrolyzing) [bacterium]